MNTERLDKTAPVLLVEDDLQDINAARSAFKQGRMANPLYVVRYGEEAMEFLQNTGPYADTANAPRPGLILLALKLPRLHGYEVLKRIKSDPNLRRIPVVVLSTSKSEADVLCCYEFGANSYVTKPVKAKEFLQTVITIGHYWLDIVTLPDGGEEVE